MVKQASSTAAFAGTASASAWTTRHFFQAIEALCTDVLGFTFRRVGFGVQA
jgi:hypothetical protein